MTTTMKFLRLCTSITAVFVASFIDKYAHGWTCSAIKKISKRTPQDPRTENQRCYTTARMGVEGPVTTSRREFLAHSLFATVAITTPQGTQALNRDEIEVTVDVSGGSLGLELNEVTYQRSFRVLVKRVLPDSAASKVPEIKPGLLIMNVNGENVEGIPAKEVKKAIARAIAAGAGAPLRLRLKDPLAFQEALRDSESAAVGEEITTTVTPSAGGIAAQEVKVERRLIPELCSAGAEYGDLLEIGYVGYLADGPDGGPGRVFDGSAVKVNGREVSGRGGDTTVFFVLGKQPTGQFPPAWDVGMLGMCVGEKRRLTIPPALGFGEASLKRRGIPAGSTLIYDVMVNGINGQSLMR